MTHTHLGLEALEDGRHHLPHLLQKKTAGVRRLDEAPARKEEGWEKPPPREPGGSGATLQLHPGCIERYC